MTGTTKILPLFDGGGLLETSSGEISRTEMRTGSLTPACRPTDPETSREAAAKISSKRVTLAKVAARLVQRFPGRTGAELDAIHGCKLTRQVSKRLADAATLGFVVRGPKRKCDEGKNNAVTWGPVK